MKRQECKHNRIVKCHCLMCMKSNKNTGTNEYACKTNTSEQESSAVWHQDNYFPTFIIYPSGLPWSHGHGGNPEKTHLVMENLAPTKLNAHANKV